MFTFPSFSHEEDFSAYCSRRTFLRLCAHTGGLIAALTADGSQANAATSQSKPHAPGEHPKVYMTPKDILRARENVARYEWARQEAEAIRKEADAWLAREDAWLLKQVPDKGACFAYGFTGCPICNASWGTWGGAHASFDNPGHVTCENGHVLPDAQHPDPGTGYVGSDGRIHYFVGSYNAWVVETLTFHAIDSLAYAYSLTADERYGAKAALLLDALATIYPSCDKGSWDYPSDPPSGRLDRPWYQVARVLVHFVDQYDQVYASPAMAARSLTAGLSRRANIEENLLKNGAAYCYQQSLKGSLHNGIADYIRGSLAVGICLDMPDYVRWAVDGPYGIYTMFENNIDRDGQYDETSTGYADWTRGLYISFAEPLWNYRGSAYPNGVDLYAHPKARRFWTLHNLALQCAGHTPAYGDSTPDPKKLMPPAHPFDRGDYQFLRYLYVRTREPGEQRKLAALLRWLASGNTNPITNRRRARGGTSEGMEEHWLLFHGRDVPAGETTLPADVARRLLGCDFFGQKGVGILRTGQGDNAQALLLRFGPSLDHGHMDDLNINYFARGYELTYDMGYGVASTHTEVGWAHQTVSHNLVVVNETSQIGPGDGTGGSLHLFADLPGLKLIEATSEPSYQSQGVSLYQRTLALIEASPHSTYLVDLFRVNGGHQHDYCFHSIGEKTSFAGLSLGAEEPGSLAGADISWGDKQLNDGDMAGYPNKPYWNPPPGNGYGFLIRPQRAQPAEGTWSADWQLDESSHVRLSMPAHTDTEVITASAPGLYPSDPHARYVLARRKGENLSSQFAAVIEPYAQSPLVTTVERLTLTQPHPGLRPPFSETEKGREGGFPSSSPAAWERERRKPGRGEGHLHEAPVGALALKISRSDGGTDYVYSSGDKQARHSGELVFAGRFACAHVRDGQLVGLSLVGGAQFSGFGWQLKPKTDIWNGTVSSVDYAHNVVTTTADLPVDGWLDGKVIVFSNEGYSRTTGYRIVRVEGAGKQRRIVLDGTTVLGKGQVGEIKDASTLTSVIPHEWAHPVGSSKSKDTGFFQGKRIRSSSGASTRVRDIRYAQPLMVLRLESVQGFKAGENFIYYDVQQGDRFEIAGLLSLKQTASDHYRLWSEAEVEVSAPEGKKVDLD